MASSTACAVEHRQRAGQAQADRADVGVGRRAEAGGAAAENLGGGGELDVHFEADHRLIARDEFRRSEVENGRGHGEAPL